MTIQIINLIDGSKIVVSIPIVKEKTSNSISISWNISPDAKSYQVGIVDTFGNLVSFFFFFFFI